MSVKFTKEDFINESIKVHKNKYDYSLVDYKKSSEKLIIICKEHGPFEQRASNHLRGRGCYSCKKSKKYNTQKFIEMTNDIHKNKYNYKKTIYDGSHTDVIITCLDHGNFKQTPTNHLCGKGCGRCATDTSRIDNFFEIVNNIHNNKYTYSGDYINLRTKILINCKEHGSFTQRAKNHLEGQGCPKCGDRFGIKENKWLDSFNIKERQVRIGKYIVDGYDSITNTIYEFNGDFWHGNPNLYNPEDYNSVSKKTFGELYRNTINREKYLIKRGYNVISIWENDFNIIYL
jgi:hypothetical protein